MKSFTLKPQGSDYPKIQVRLLNSKSPFADFKVIIKSSSTETIHSCPVGAERLLSILSAWAKLVQRRDKFNIERNFAAKHQISYPEV